MTFELSLVQLPSAFLGRPPQNAWILGCEEQKTDTRSISEKKSDASGEIRTHPFLLEFTVIENAIELVVLIQRSNVVYASAPEPPTEGFGVLVRRAIVLTCLEPPKSALSPEHEREKVEVRLT